MLFSPDPRQLGIGVWRANRLGSLSRPKVTDVRIAYAMLTCTHVVRVCVCACVPGEIQPAICLANDVDLVYCAREYSGGTAVGN